jgi:hypothetical protein
MFSLTWVAFILEAGSQSAADTQTGVDLLQEQRASVAGEKPSGEIGDNFARTEILKKHRGILTLCLAVIGSCFSAACSKTESYNKV